MNTSQTVLVSIIAIILILSLLLTLIKKPNKQLNSDSIRLFFSYAFVLSTMVIVLVPILVAMWAPLNPTLSRGVNPIANVADMKFEPTLSAFSRLFQTNYVKWFGLTAVVALMSTVLSIFSVSILGYAFSRYRFKGKKMTMIGMLVIQMIPTLSAMAAFIGFSFFIRYYVGGSGILTVFTLFGVKASEAAAYFTLVLIYLGGGIAMNTFLMKGNYDIISRDFDEAARIDGAGPFRIFWQIILPLMRPMIATVSLFSFIGPFFDAFLPKLILPPGNYLIANYLFDEFFQPRSATYDFGVFSAGAILLAIPITLFFIYMQKYLISGLSSGGSKG